MSAGVVLDSSAVLALFLVEDGHERVAEVWSNGVVTSVNLCEIVSRFARIGVPAHEASQKLGVADVQVVDVTRADGELAGSFGPQTRQFGLSLSGRICLSVASRLGMKVLTADRMWGELDLGVEVELIR